MWSSTLLDELGYLAYDARAADLIFQLVSRRYEHRSLLITTNLPFKRWDTTGDDRDPHVVNETARWQCRKTRFYAIANTPTPRSRNVSSVAAARSTSALQRAR